MSRVRKLAAVAITGLFMAACSDDTPAYRDGTYRATGRYGSLPSSIDVTVELDDGILRDVDVTPHATDPTSRDYQERFADAVPAIVTGRRIDEVELDRVAGSSGTPDGFNDALERIKDQAAK
jgi:uncharacterized protein with FMN-binding domain